MITVRNRPGVFFWTRRPKITSTSEGRPSVVEHSTTRSKNARARAGRSRIRGAGELDLVHGGLPLVAGFEVPGSEWERDALHGSLEEVLELAGAQPAAGPAQRPGIVHGGEAIGKGDVADALLLELALHPLMPVAPELGRVWEVRAHLQEGRTPLLVQSVEVVDGHPPLHLLEGVVGTAGVGVPGHVGAHDDPLNLLGLADHRHPRLGHLLEVGGGDIDLALPGWEGDHLDPVVLSEGGHRLAVGVPHGPEQGRGGDGVAPVIVQEVDDAAGGLQLGLVDVAIDAVEALNVEDDVALEQLGERRRGGGGHELPFPRTVLTGLGKGPDSMPEASSDPPAGHASAHALRTSLFSAVRGCLTGTALT